MKKTIIAFDVDWTLIDNINVWTCQYVPNENIRTLLILLSRCKNVKIVVWSWWWEIHARQAVRLLWIEKYVWKIMSKNHLWKEDWKHKFEPEIVPDIAIDDIQDCKLWDINLIVREK